MRRTDTQQMNEAEMLTSIFSERNEKTRLSKLKQGTKSPVSPTLDEREAPINTPKRTDKDVAEKIGMKKTTYTKAKNVWDTAKTGDTYAKSLDHRE